MTKTLLRLPLNVVKAAMSSVFSIFYNITHLTSLMSLNLHEQVLALHRHYNQVEELQQQLPARRPRHDNHAAQERRVQDKAQEVMAAARQLPCIGTGYQDEVENIIAGCQIMQNDPYKKLGGIRNV